MGIARHEQFSHAFELTSTTSGLSDSDQATSLLTGTSSSAPSNAAKRQSAFVRYVARLRASRPQYVNKQRITSEDFIFMTLPVSNSTFVVRSGATCALSQTGLAQLHRRPFFLSASTGRGPALMATSVAFPTDVRAVMICILATCSNPDGTAGFWSSDE